MATILFAFISVSRGQPVITQNPQSALVTVGQSVSITVAAQGTRLHYRWEFNGRKLARRGHTYRFRASAHRAGVYQVIVRDRVGNTVVSEPAVIAVLPRVTTPPPDVQPSPKVHAPVIVTQPQNISVAEHATAVFQVTLNDSGPYSTIVWHNDNPLEGSHQIPDGIGLNVHSTRLEIPNCLDADNYNGLYWIAVTNAAGGTVSSKARLTVIPAR